MNRVRLLLALVIALALPWQGVKATTRVHCQAIGGSAATAHASQHADRSLGPHMHAANAEATSGHHAHAVHGDAATGQSKADCGAFCCAATISASPALMIVPVPPLVPLPRIQAVRPSYNPDGFDRPPRI